MAWRCSGTTNVELITRLREASLITTDRCQEAMAKTDRAHYVRMHRDAYVDSPSGIGYGATISAPHMHASAVENLLPFLKPGSRVLDVGCGSGYLLGIFHNLVAPTGHVTGIEHIRELSDLSERNLRADGHGPALDSKNVTVVTGDGRQGYAQGAPYDAIHVGAAAPVMPKALIEQLARPGRMFIPVGTYEQMIWQVDKDEEGNVKKEALMAVRYVPLTDAPKAEL